MEHSSDPIETTIINPTTSLEERLKGLTKAIDKLLKSANILPPMLEGNKLALKEVEEVIKIAKALKKEALKSKNEFDAFNSDFRKKNEELKKYENGNKELAALMDRYKANYENVVQKEAEVRTLLKRTLTENQNLKKINQEFESQMKNIGEREKFHATLNDAGKFNLESAKEVVTLRKEIKIQEELSRVQDLTKSDLVQKLRDQDDVIRKQGKQIQELYDLIKGQNEEAKKYKRSFADKFKDQEKALPDQKAINKKSENII